MTDPLRDVSMIGLRGPPLLLLVIALAAGVGFWTIWSRVIGLVNRHVRRPLALQADAAV